MELAPTLTEWILAALVGPSDETVERDRHLLPLVEKFFAERIFGPMRLDKLERQLRAHDRRIARETNKSRKNLAKKLEDLERRINLQVQALETGLEPQLVGKRIAELRNEKDRLEAAMAETASEVPQASIEEIAGALERLPDLSDELRKAPTELKRQVFEAFQVRVGYDKLERRITISATVSEAVADAFHNAKDLPEEVHCVAQKDIAGARYVPPSDARVIESMRLAA